MKTASLDPEQPISISLLNEISVRLQFREEVSPRLLVRVLVWSCEEIARRQWVIQAALAALKEE